MGNIIDLLVPDIGDFAEVPVVEIMVQLGEVLTPDTAVVTLESDKASMEVPAEVTGVVTEILVAEGDLVSEGSLLLRYEKGEGLRGEDSVVEPDKILKQKIVEVQVIKEQTNPLQQSVSVQPEKEKMSMNHGPAGPAVRRLARELGVKLADVSGSGPKGRLQKEDIRAYVKRVMQSGGPQKASYEEPIIDFSAFGPIETSPLSRIQRISGPQLAKNWAAIPHVTSFDEADITEIEAFRRELNQEQPVKLTLLPFMIKAVQNTLQVLPQLNSSLQGGQLIIKKYYHIGFAVDTPGGLLVPVIRDVDKKGLVQIATEVSELALLAREGKLKAEHMQGGTFTISSLGSVGGTHFTPIINAPEVAILALGRSSIKPQWKGSEFIPRQILPLSLSWDHRALDGVTASRFNVHLCRVLADFRRVVL
ncbi:2-oxo acid dehydrogenase subunit E2 [Desulfosediminicola flagellatus]|uniref:2-oxo acid dehydrogenase subunit E2 n=1 Tax=Desulfosediminicola flagellatus TaxID=2569541 RepID=UPI0010ACFBE2|nr:2-oxo acid dehydrogenase subunit E2 [Desulfosediminicola flagellatus]